jgi:hypothetical protein
MSILNRNKGLCWERAHIDSFDGQPNYEKMFQETWDEYNREKPGVDFGNGMAQDLFIVPKQSADCFDGPNQERVGLGQNVCVYDLTAREHRIIATIIQWLGTNVGFSFLRICLKKCGYLLVPIREKKKIPESKRNRYSMLLGGFSHH